MTCPNCNRFMKDKSYSYYGFGDWDMDYPSTLHEEHICPHCKIKYVNGDWIIPERFLASEKQQRTMLFINSVLHIGIPAPTKTKAHSYISKHFDAAKRMKEQLDIEWCEDNAGWLPEYF